MSVHIAFETPKDVQDSVYELVKLVANDNGRLKKGSNEVTKAAERGTAQMVVMAENVNPGELLMPIPLICKERGIPYIYVADQSYLGEAAGLPEGRQTAAIAVLNVDQKANDDFQNAVKAAGELAGN